MKIGGLEQLYITKIIYTEPFYSALMKMTAWCIERETTIRYIAAIDDSTNLSIQGPDGKWEQIK